MSLSTFYYTNTSTYIKDTTQADFLIGRIADSIYSPILSALLLEPLDLNTIKTTAANSVVNQEFTPIGRFYTDDETALGNIHAPIPTRGYTCPGFKFNWDIQAFKTDAYGSVDTGGFPAVLAQSHLGVNIHTGDMSVACSVTDNGYNIPDGKKHYGWRGLHKPDTVGTIVRPADATMSTITADPTSSVLTVPTSTVNNPRITLVNETANTDTSFGERVAVSTSYVATVCRYTSTIGAGYDYAVYVHSRSTGALLWSINSTFTSTNIGYLVRGIFIANDSKIVIAGDSGVDVYDAVAQTLTYNIPVGVGRSYRSCVLTKNNLVFMEIEDGTANHFVTIHNPLTGAVISSKTIYCGGYAHLFSSSESDNLLFDSTNMYTTLNSTAFPAYFTGGAQYYSYMHYYNTALDTLTLVGVNGEIDTTSIIDAVYNDDNIVYTRNTVVTFGSNETNMTYRIDVSSMKITGKIKTNTNVATESTEVSEGLLLNSDWFICSDPASEHIYVYRMLDTTNTLFKGYIEKPALGVANGNPSTFSSKARMSLSGSYLVVGRPKEGAFINGTDGAGLYHLFDLTSLL